MWQCQTSQIPAEPGHERSVLVVRGRGWKKTGWFLTYQGSKTRSVPFLPNLLSSNPTPGSPCWSIPGQTLDLIPQRSAAAALWIPTSSSQRDQILVGFSITTCGKLTFKAPAISTTFKPISSLSCAETKKSDMTTKISSLPSPITKHSFEKTWRQARIWMGKRCRQTKRHILRSQYQTTLPYELFLKITRQINGHLIPSIFTTGSVKGLSKGIR